MEMSISSPKLDAHNTIGIGSAHIRCLFIYRMKIM